MLYRDVQLFSQEMRDQLTIFQFIFRNFMASMPEETARKTFSDMQLWCVSSEELLEGILHESGTTPDSDDDAFDEVLDTLAGQIQEVRADLADQLREIMQP